MPEIKSITTLFFENLLPVLKLHVNIHMIWLVYQPDRINPPQKISDNVTIEDIHDYDNAIELLQKQKPDLIFASMLNLVTILFHPSSNFLPVSQQ